MRKVDRSEILPLGEYEAIRDRFRSRVIAQKQRRRLALGPQMSALFENHDTVLLQIQEMLRTERITRADAVQHEIDTYNELVPDADALSMTLFVEIPEREERERMLTALAGLETSVWLEIDGERVQAKAGEREGAEPGRTTAVHYFTIPLPSAAADKLRARSAKAALLVDHPAYQARVELSPDVLAELSADLAE